MSAERNQLQHRNEQKLQAIPALPIRDPEPDPAAAILPNNPRPDNKKANPDRLRLPIPSEEPNHNHQQQHPQRVEPAP